MSDCIKKQFSTICCVKETHLTGKDKHKLKVKKWDKIFQEVRPETSKNSYIYIEQSKLQTKFTEKKIKKVISF
jgi:hypothetical protein